MIFKDVDISGKWVLMLRGYPESNPAAAAYADLSSDRMKVLTCKGERGSRSTACLRRRSGIPADNLDKPARGEGRAGIPVLQIKEKCG
ncbi:MAG: hypothetical protein MZV63_29890 [Marinilabiliales bacterium]|nr:hypothetical protein [Marinilabiliales bacterium]